MVDDLLPTGRRGEDGREHGRSHVHTVAHAAVGRTGRIANATDGGALRRGGARAG